MKEYIFIQTIEGCVTSMYVQTIEGCVTSMYVQTIEGCVTSMYVQTIEGCVMYLLEPLLFPQVVELHTCDDVRSTLYPIISSMIHTGLRTHTNTCI